MTCGALCRCADKIGEGDECTASCLPGKEGSDRHMRWKEAGDADYVGARDGKAASERREGQQSRNQEEGRVQIWHQDCPRRD